MSQTENKGEKRPAHRPAKYPGEEMTTLSLRLPNRLKGKMTTYKKIEVRWFERPGTIEATLLRDEQGYAVEQGSAERGSLQIVLSSLPEEIGRRRLEDALRKTASKAMLLLLAQRGIIPSGVVLRVFWASTTIPNRSNCDYRLFENCPEQG